MAKPGNHDDYISGAQAVDALAELNDPLSPAGADNRSHTRHSWRVPITLSIIEHTGQGESVREIKVTTSDLSQGGFAFIHRSFIAPGSQVHARLDSLPHRPQIVGLVRYCRLREGIEHMIGVQFISPSQIRRN